MSLVTETIILDCWFWVPGCRSCVLNSFDHVFGSNLFGARDDLFPLFPLLNGEEFGVPESPSTDSRRLATSHCCESVLHGLSQVSIQDPFKNIFSFRKPTDA